MKRRLLLGVARQLNGWNALLAGGLAVLIFWTILPIYRAGGRFVLPTVHEKRAVERKDASGTDEPGINDLAVVAEENMFHPDRRMPPLQKKQEKPAPRPEFVLYGTFITPERKIAFIEDKTNSAGSPGKAHSQTALKVGDMLSGFEVRQIEPTRVVLAKGIETVVIGLDLKRQRPGTGGSNTPGAIVPRFSGGAPPPPRPPGGR